MLLPELRAVMALTCGKAALVFHAERDWRSATFSGTRHRIALRFAGEDAMAYAEAFIAHLPRHEFALAGKLVADAEIVSAERIFGEEPETTLTLQMLVLNDV